MMKRLARRFWSWLFLLASGAALFQADMACTGTGGGGYFGFSRFATNSAGSAINWCFLLDCENGFFGGLVDPCNDPSMGPWLLDCPNAGTTTDDGTTDNGTDTNTDNTANQAAGSGL